MRTLIIVDPKLRQLREVETTEGWVHNLREITGDENFDCICSAGYVADQNDVWFPVYVEDQGIYKYSHAWMHPWYSQPLLGPGIIAMWDEGDMMPDGSIVDDQTARINMDIQYARTLIQWPFHQHN